MFLFNLISWSFTQLMAKTNADIENAEELSEEVTFIGTEVTTSHYIPKRARDRCQNEACARLFSHIFISRRPHHCKRCGEIFCRPCLQYSRRLNIMAQPDPDGILCKVCRYCFEDRGLNLGCTKRSQTELFLQFRKQVKGETSDIVYETEITRRASEQPRFWNEHFKIDILHECLRLLQGFKTAVGSSETLKAVTEIKGRVYIPAWQKSTLWTLESRMTRCRQCDGRLGRIRKIRNCRVCGLTLCRSCSQKELLLYFADGQPRTKDESPHLAIIRYIGCPDIEPNLSLLLRCCNDCKDEIVRRQIEDQRWYLQKPKPPDLQSEIVRMDSHFQNIFEDIRDEMKKLTSMLEKPSEIIEEVFGDDSTNSLGEFESKRTTCAIKQLNAETLKDSINTKLRTFSNMYSELRSIMKSEKTRLTSKQNDFIMNYFMAKKDFYIKTKAELGKLTKSNEK